MVKEFRFDIELNGKSYNLSARERKNNGVVEYIIGIPTYFHYKDQNGVLQSAPSERMIRMINTAAGGFSFVPFRKEMIGVGVYAILQEVSNFLVDRRNAT